MTTIDKDTVKFIDFLWGNYKLLEEGWILKGLSRFNKNNFKTTEELYDEWNNFRDLDTV